MIYNGASGTKGVSMPSSMKPSLSKSFSPLATLLVLAVQARAYATFVISALLIGAFYLRILAFSLPIHIPERINIPLLSISAPLWLPVPHRPRKDMTLRQWRNTTAPSSPFSKLIGLDAKWRNFIGQVLVPLFSAVCTAGAEDIWDHPVEEFLGTSVRISSFPQVNFFR